MVERIYNRQNYNVGMVETPKAPMKNDHNISQGLSFFSQQSWKMAQRSYDLGKKEILNSIVNEAYNLYPNDKKAFLGEVQKNFKKHITGLSEPMQRDAFHSMQKLVNGYNDQIDKNIYQRQNEILSQRTANQYKNGMAGMESSYMSMIDDGIQNNNTSFNKELTEEEKKQKRRTLEESFKSNQAIYNMAKQSAQEAAEARNPDGHRILRDTQGLNKLSLWKRRIYDLSAEDLKNFDNTTFKDRNAFMDAFDINDREYEELGSYISKTLKEFGEEREKREKNSMEYAVARMSQVWDEDAMNEAQKQYPDLFSDDFVKALRINSEFKANTVLMQDDDVNFLNQMNRVVGLANYQFDGTEENERGFYQTATDVLNNLNEYRTKYGSSIMNKEILDDMVTGAMSNRMFADEINKNIYDKSSALGQVLNDEAVQIAGVDNAERVKEQMLDTNNRTYEIQSAKRRQASRGAKLLLAQAQRYNTSEASTQEGIDRIANDMSLLKQDINRRIIAEDLRGYYSPDDLLRMQESFEKGNKNQYIEINGLVYKFGGFTNNNIILEK